MDEIWSPLEKCEWKKLEDEISIPLLKKQIDYVCAKSKFYQKKIDFFKKHFRFSIGEFKRFPFTSKQEILDDEKVNPPFGSNLIGSFDLVQRVHRTSGTSTEPLMLAFSASDLDSVTECGARCFWSSGVRPQDMIVHCLNYCMWAGGITDHLSLERTGAAVIPYGVGNSTNLIRTILQLRPTGIHCTPSYLFRLGELLKNEFSITPSQLGLKIGLFGGEGGIDNEEFRLLIEQVWGFKAMNSNYGMSDVLSMFGAECKERSGLHFMGQGVIYAELKDPSGDAILPWERGVRGELVLTNLSKELQPLVRYRTSDIIEVIGVEECVCGRRSPRFRIVGRSEDMIVIKGVNVFLSSVTAVINQRLDVLTGDFRVVVDRLDPIEHFIVRAEVRSGKVYESLTQEIEDLLKQELYVRPTLELLAEGSFPKNSEKTKRLERSL